MPNWKTIIVGDAFQIPSQHFDYYRDRFLVWPFLLFTIAGLANLLSRSRNPRIVFILTALAVLCLLIAKERLILVGIALGVCAVAVPSIFRPQTGLAWAMRWFGNWSPLCGVDPAPKGLPAELWLAQEANHRRSSAQPVIAGCQRNCDSMACALAGSLSV